jgi:hypothetical protein
MKYILLMASLLSLVLADIYVSGDARVRPRMVIEDIPSVTKESDLYFMYRARINIKADIGKGYFINLKLGTNDVSSMSKMGADGGFTSSSSDGIKNSARPEVHFLELYFGFQKEHSGLSAGAFPLKYNPALDIHFYHENKMVDIPWASYNNNTITGFSGYRKFMQYKLKWFLSVDLNNINSNETVREPYFEGPNDSLIVPGNLITELKDTYTLGFNTSIDVGPISITPRLLYTLADESENAPLTLGGDIKLPDIVGFGSSVSYYMSSNSNESASEGTIKYDANHIRVKLGGKVGPGNLSFFYDMASKTLDGDTQMDFNYFWLSYKYTIHKSEMGSLTLKPTLRMQNGGYDPGNVFVKDYSKTKIELTTEFKFN